MIKDSIPENDLKDINDSFKTSKSNVIKKNARGKVVSAQTDLINPRTGFKFKSYVGKVLKHNKMVILEDGRQITVGFKGQRYEEITSDERKLVQFMDSDFE